MRVLAALVILLLLGVAGYLAQRSQENPAEPEPEPVSDPAAGPGEPLRFEWARQRERCGDLTFVLPATWLGTRVEHEPGYISYSAPSDDDFMPQLQVLWGASQRNLEEWSAWMGNKARHDELAEIVGEGRFAMAGTNATYLIYERSSRRNKSEPMRPFRTIDFYFVRNGHGGMLRGVTTARTFPRYRPVFEEIARRLRYDPAER